MAKKTYTCKLWPHLHLGWVQFRDGTYTTDDEAEQYLIEHSDTYGVHVCLLEGEESEQESAHPAGQTDMAPEDDAGEGGQVVEDPSPRRGPGRPSGSGVRQDGTGTGQLRGG